MISEFIHHILVNLYSIPYNRKLQAQVIPVCNKLIEQSCIVIEDWIPLLHHAKVKVQRSRNHLSKRNLKFFGLLLKNLHGPCYDKDASPLLPDATSGSLLPLVQQDVAVGASIEVSFGPVSGPRVACSGISFSFHRINLDNQIATGYQNSATVAFNH